jgi:hypothetical protein
MVGLFIVAAAVTAVAIPPSLALGGRQAGRTRMLDGASASADPSASTRGPDPDGPDSTEPGLAL